MDGLARFYCQLAAQSAATREAMNEAEPEALSFTYDPSLYSACFCAYAPEKLNSDEAVRKLAGLDRLPYNGCEPEKGYGSEVGFRCDQDSERAVVLYDRHGTWRMSGNAEDLAAFERWAAGQFE